MITDTKSSTEDIKNVYSFSNINQHDCTSKNSFLTKQVAYTQNHMNMHTCQGERNTFTKSNLEIQTLILQIWPPGFFQLT